MSHPKEPPDESFGAASAEVPYQRPRVRPDLRIVYENDARAEDVRAGGRAGDRTGDTPRIRVVDPANGRQFSFSAREYRLFAAADGETSLREIHDAVAAGGDAPPAQEVVAFFRRLHILGLLAGGADELSAEGPGQPQAVPSGQPGVSGRNRGSASLPPRGRRGDAAAAVIPPTAGGAVEVLPGPAPEGEILAPAPAPATGVRRRPPRFGTPHPKPQPAPAAEAVSSGLVAVPPVPVAADGGGDPGQDLGDPDPLDIVAGRLADAATAEAADLDDDFGLTTAFGGMGGLGGMGGGLGGGAGGGQFGGMGGMVGGGPNRERLMAAIAARRGQGGAAPGATAFAGGMRPAEEPEDRARPVSLVLLDPTLLLRLIYVLFYPVKFFLWLLVPMVVLAGVTAVQNWPQLVADHLLLAREYAAVTLVIIGLFTVNLASRLAQGVAILAHGGKARGFGIMLVFGFIPRFFIDTSGVAALDRRGHLWAHAAPVLARLTLFAAGMLTWAITREGGAWLPLYALIVGQFGLAMFVFSAMPLLPGDGQRWLAVYLDEPRLLPKAGAALRHLLTGKPLPPMMERHDLWPLALFAAGTLVSVLAVVLTLGAHLAIWLEAELGGMGVSLFLTMVAGFLVWLLALRLTIGRRVARMRARAGQAAEFGAGGMAAGADPMLGRVVDPQRRGAAAVALPGTEGETGAEPATGARVVWGLILVGLLAVAFLPYEYEAGGPVEILPAARAQAVARTSGEVVEILVAEGDVVTRGQLLAQLSSWDQENGVNVTRAMLDGAEANLARLQAGAKPEALELAMRQLDRAQASLDYSQAAADRARELVASGTISQQAYEQAIAAYDADRAGLDVAQANLDLVRSGATAEEIAIAGAEVARLAEELAFREDEVARTRIEAPMDGRVITSDLELRHGAFLTVGETLVEIEDAGTITATIAVPEADIGLIEPGDGVRLRIWGQSGNETLGTVRDIATVATGTSHGNVVLVEAAFPNPDGLLRSGMTGYAKIDGAEMRVWEAYLRSVGRFFQIEVWSWIP